MGWISTVSLCNAGWLQKRRLQAGVRSFVIDTAVLSLFCQRSHADGSVAQQYRWHQASWDKWALICFISSEDCLSNALARPGATAAWLVQCVEPAVCGTGLLACVSPALALICHACTRPSCAWPGILWYFFSDLNMSTSTCRRCL